MKVLASISLLPYNTFRINAQAKCFFRLAHRDQLTSELPEMIKRLGLPQIIGGGSNILLTNDHYPWVLRNEIKGIDLIKEDKDHYYVRAGAGENWHQFVLHCIDQGYAGVENLSLIPGNVGASPMQNIGAYGVEIKDVFYELEAFDLHDYGFRIFNLEECKFGYRESVFKKDHRGRFLITSVTFRLNKVPVFNTSYGAIGEELDKMKVKELSIQAISQAVINIRSSKLPDPAEIGNAGSFFKNPEVEANVFEALKGRYPNISAFPLPTGRVKLAAAWLIEQCGWKGYRKGDAGCYPKQALVLVNYGKATGKEILALSDEIIASVTEKFGVNLEREVNVL
jgi:UDP-N-acetylmuramate dehydrogenase